MADINSTIMGETNFLNLKELKEKDIRREILDFLVDGESIIAAFATVRDQVIFTTKRIIVVNVQGVVGKKISYMCYPYSRVQYYKIETAGVLDIDSEMVLVFSDGAVLQFDFRARVDIKKICTAISAYIL